MLHEAVLSECFLHCSPAPCFKQHRTSRRSIILGEASQSQAGEMASLKQEQDERKSPKWVYLWLPRSRRSKPQNRERKGGKCEVSGCCGCPNVSPWLCVQSMVLFCILFSSASSTKLDTKFHLQGHIVLAPTPGGQRAALALPEGFMAADDEEGKKTQCDFQV